MGVNKAASIAIAKQIVLQVCLNILFDHFTSNLTFCIGTGQNPKNTWVHQLFEGVFSNETKCLSCETVSLILTFSDYQILDIYQLIR